MSCIRLNEKCRKRGVGFGRRPFHVISANARFPPPWTVEALDGGFKIVDANGQSLAYVYGAR